ncbi:hypothetical protein NM688_g8617 [Phlebia brevispora]|uniref:Uncharacterized protein n=1 Tax=Phlebia brevispora TaxID=194682 RepID=A0ACC1RQW3_9APHY|nr:hypothetical protein NM688_g8617 [Phlebia brevispora]
MEASLRLVPASTTKSASIQDTANAQGLHDTLAYGPRSLATEIKSTGATTIRDRLDNWEATQDNLKLTMQRNAFGLHMPVRQLMERQLVGYNPHMPEFRTSNVHLDILMGRDETLETSDFMTPLRVPAAHGHTCRYGEEAPHVEIATQCIFLSSGIATVSALMFGLAAPQRPSLRTCLPHDKSALRGYLRSLYLHIQLTNQSAQATAVFATNQVACFIDTEYSHHELWQVQLSSLSAHSYDRRMCTSFQRPRRHRAIMQTSILYRLPPMVKRFYRIGPFDIALALVHINVALDRFLYNEFSLSRYVHVLHGIPRDSDDFSISRAQSITLERDRQHVQRLETPYVAYRRRKRPEYKPGVAEL